MTNVNVKNFNRFRFSGPTGVVLKIDGDGAVFAFVSGAVWHGSPQVKKSVQRLTYDEGNALRLQGETARNSGLYH